LLAIVSATNHSALVDEIVHVAKKCNILKEDSVPPWFNTKWQAHCIISSVLVVHYE
jgi:hypothetical protein